MPQLRGPGATFNFVHTCARDHVDDGALVAVKHLRQDQFGQEHRRDEIHADLLVEVLHRHIDQRELALPSLVEGVVHQDVDATPLFHHRVDAGGNRLPVVEVDPYGHGVAANFRDGGGRGIKVPVEGALIRASEGARVTATR